MSEANHQPPPPQPYPPYTYYQPDEDELSLVDLWNIVWKRKWLIFLLGPLAGLLGIFYALRSPEIYRAEATVAPNFEDRNRGGLSAALAGQLGGLASLAGVGGGGEISTEKALATLRSRKFLIPFITQEERLRALFPREWDQASERWLVAKDRRGADNRPTSQEAYERFIGSVMQLSEDRRSGLITISIELENAEQAAAWLNELIDKLNAALRQQARDDAAKSLAFLDRQLQETQILEIRQAIYSLVETQTKNAMMASAREDYAFRVIDPAIAPERRAKPQRSLIVLASGLLGGFVAIFLCFVLHFVEQAKKTKERQLAAAAH